MLKIKVRNMTSPRTSKEVANQFEVFTPEGTYFQSYNSIIAVKPRCENPNAGCDNEFCPCPQHDNKIVLDETYWNYSNTTAKYRNKFLGESTKETALKIKSGQYIFADLN